MIFTNRKFLSNWQIMHQKEVNSPKSTMVTLAYACSKPNTMMIKLKNAFVTIMAVLCSWRLQIWWVKS